MNNDSLPILLQSLGISEESNPLSKLAMELLNDSGEDTDEKRNKILAAILQNANSEESADADQIDVDPFTIDEEISNGDFVSNKSEDNNSSRRLENSLRDDDINSEFEYLRGRNDELATALGACYLCWGDDSQCPHCSGLGSPGRYKSDSELFNKYVRPALSRLKQRNNNPNKSADKSMPIDGIDNNIADNERR